MEVKVSTERKNSRNGRELGKISQNHEHVLKRNFKRTSRKRNGIIDLLKVNLYYILIKDNLLSI